MTFEIIISQQLCHAAIFTGVGVSYKPRLQVIQFYPDVRICSNLVNWHFLIALNKFPMTILNTLLQGPGIWKMPH